MQIELVKIGKPTKSGNTTKVDIEYVRDGKNVKRALHGYGKTKDVIQGLNDFVEGDIAEVELEKAEKDGQTYWNWVGITKVNGAAAVAAKKSEYKSTYETPEERAEKNVRITRMACLNSAVQFSERLPKSTPDDIMRWAERFVSFVMQTEQLEERPAQMAKATAAAAKGVKAAGGDEFQDDIPF